MSNVLEVVDTVISEDISNIEKDETVKAAFRLRAKNATELDGFSGVFYHSYWKFCGI